MSDIRVQKSGEKTVPSRTVPLRILPKAKKHERYKTTLFLDGFRKALGSEYSILNFVNKIRSMYETIS